MRHLWLSALVATSQAIGCQPGNTTASGGTSDAAAPSDSAPSSWSPLCPNDTPAEGSPCGAAAEGAQCEYGTATWNAACDTVLQCSKGVWTKFVPPNIACHPPNGGQGSCPSLPPASGASCSSLGDLCTFASGAQCTCSGADGGMATWSCLPERGCPAVRPRLGSACSGLQSCTYASCAYMQTCTGGVWAGRPLGC